MSTNRVVVKLALNALINYVDVRWAWPSLLLLVLLLLGQRLMHFAFIYGQCMRVTQLRRLPRPLPPRFTSSPASLSRPVRPRQVSSVQREREKEIHWHSSDTFHTFTGGRYVSSIRLCLQRLPPHLLLFSYQLPCSFICLSFISFFFCDCAAPAFYE